MLDRIDMNISVKRIEYDELYGEGIEESSAKIKRRIMTAQQVQQKRLKLFRIQFNSQIPASALEEVCQLGIEERKMRKDIFEQYKLTARGAGKVLRVARTIADLDHSEKVKCDHLWEALSYRMSDFYQGGAKQ